MLISSAMASSSDRSTSAFARVALLAFVLGMVDHEGNGGSLVEVGHSNPLDEKRSSQTVGTGLPVFLRGGKGTRSSYVPRVARPRFANLTRHRLTLCLRCMDGVPARGWPRGPGAGRKHIAGAVGADVCFKTSSSTASWSSRSSSLTCPRYRQPRFHYPDNAWASPQHRRRNRR